MLKGKVTSTGHLYLTKDVLEFLQVKEGDVLSFTIDPTSQSPEMSIKKAKFKNKCVVCEGFGIIDGNEEMLDCFVCSGSGELVESQKNPTLALQEMIIKYGNEHNITFSIDTETCVVAGQEIYLPIIHVNSRLLADHVLVTINEYFKDRVIHTYANDHFAEVKELLNNKQKERMDKSAWTKQQEQVEIEDFEDIKKDIPVDLLSDTNLNVW